jgi:hypothetical protein
MESGETSQSTSANSHGDGHGADPESPGRTGLSIARAQVIDSPSGGVVRMQINRFDPLEGWQFSRMIRVRVGSGGVAAVRWTPPSVGRWQVRATYRGTRSSSPSRSNVARLLVG